MPRHRLDARAGMFFIPHDDGAGEAPRMTTAAANHAFARQQRRGWSKRLQWERLYLQLDG